MAEEALMVNSNATTRLTATVLSALVASTASAPAAAQERTLLSGEQLGEVLLGNVVRVQSQEPGRTGHGFGLVIGSDAASVYVATAQHVTSGDARSRSTRSPLVSFCKGTSDLSMQHAAKEVASFGPDGHDIAILKVPLPGDYNPLARVLAPASDTVVGAQTWVLGSSAGCGLSPRVGAIAALPDDLHNLRIQFPGLQGGSSGAPVFSGYGVVGITTDAGDQTFTVYSIDHVQRMVQARDAAWWTLVAAGNVPPTDPRAAEIDLAESVNRYLFAVRNVQTLLLQPEVGRKRFFDFATDYNNAFNRFKDARNKYDNVLSTHWDPVVLQQWTALSSLVWEIHRPNFFELMNQHAAEISRQQRSPPVVVDRMKALEPQLLQLEADSGKFLRALGNRRIR